ncbi:PhzF family phenazine biosynthesis protein [Saccharopolyspora sp. K220]|uniref:PhzF family phenazine biosynthesis protein n=1 Tax=Saccharopolyspora soli TaxID=2926618 RepID=UPI001F595A72|nr:PhzF family phenazine biosynthesis protein [Saccharopolyspora soli]MCI2416554.1 PhzF family phenazine biosynthesis protein [Saccharopolyspora soli]
MPPKAHLVNVFAAGPGGGNPAPIVVDADPMSDRDMQALARSYGHESGFVRSAPPDSRCDYALRFWVPNHEMPMCGHATVAAVWLLDQLGELAGDHLTVSTRSGPVHARLSGPVGDRTVEITQPRGEVEPVDDDAMPALLDVLGMTPADLAPLPVQNARTSRVKTLIPVADVAVLDGLRPDFGRVERVCGLLASTGLYPYAVSDADHQVFDARQFPRASGYPEDAATGIAAAALSFGLLANGLVDNTDRRIRVRQGRAMGRPSEIAVRFVMRDGQADGLWLGGSAELQTTQPR